MAKSPHADPQSRIKPGQARVGDLVCGSAADCEPVTLAVRITNNKDWARVAMVPSFVGGRNEYWLALSGHTLQAVVFGPGTTWVFHDAG